jgi:SAM-dependent methyltransferase
MVEKLVDANTEWLDVGCGRHLFRNNKPLAHLLSTRCRLLVGVEPDDTLDENPYVHERAKTTLQDYRTNHTFDLITLRMVAEHIIEPQTTAQALANLTRPGGRVVVYTIFKWSPVPIFTRLIPFDLHHIFKYMLWRTEAKDTFPVAYRMNTRRCLAELFEAAGFFERHCYYLDDCRVFAQFRLLNFLELSLQKLSRALRLHYPEVCLLGVYERR